MKIMICAIITVLCLLLASYGQRKQSKKDGYINQQLKIIEAHKKLLVTAGRITDPVHFQAEMYLAEYGWHSSCGDSKGTAPIFCDGGSFGAYSFSQEAFEQAKKLYVIHGTVDAGTDILVDASYGEMIPDKNGAIWGDSEGNHSPIGKGAFDPSIVGYTVGALTYCEKYGNHDKYCSEDDFRGATVIRYIDGGHVQISKTAKHDAVMYGLVIKPPDFVDMCDCTSPTGDLQ